jgi:hypothetical protein
MDPIWSPEMSRRAFMAAVAGGLLAAPLTAGAQQAGKVFRVGYLVLGSIETLEGGPSLDAFRQGLRESG